MCRRVELKQKAGEASGRQQDTDHVLGRGCHINPLTASDLQAETRQVRPSRCGPDKELSLSLEEEPEASGLTPT